MSKTSVWRTLVVFAILTFIAVSPVDAKSLYTHGPGFNVSFNPQGSAQVGQDVNIHIKVDSANPGATRISVSCGGVSKGETSEVEFDSSWRTGDCWAGNANVNVCTKAPDDPDWQDPDCQDFGYELTAPPAPATPTCNIDSFDVWPRIAIVGEQIQISGSGSCSNVGVRAIKVKVDGGDLYEIGAPSLSWTWNTSGVSVGNHNLSLWIAGQGDNNWDYAAKSGNIVVSVLAPNQQPAESPSPFQTGSIIDINGNLFVIVVENGSMERRHIPNPETLDALGIPRAWVDNKGWSNGDLKSIHQGPDIPDVNRDYNGFIDFKNRYFPNTTPIVPNEQDGSTQNQSTTSPSSGGQVQIIPNGPQGLASDGECPASPSVLTVGGNAQIAGKDLNLRPKPNVNTDPLTIIPNFTEVKVVDGPRCKQEVRWFMVEYKGVQGWAAEVGTGGEYHMYPIIAIQPTSEEPQAGTQQQGSVSEDRIAGTILAQCPMPQQIEELSLFEKLFGVTRGANDRFEEGQCTSYVYDQRPDVAEWIPGSGADAHTWNDSASNAGLIVDHNPVAGDIVVFEKSCGADYEGYGHVAYVIRVFDDNGVQKIKVNEANADGKGTVTEGSIYPVLDSNCMSFIHAPVETSPQGEGDEQPADDQSQTSDTTLWDTFVNWLSSLFK